VVGGRLERAVGPPEPAGDELLARHPHVLEPRTLSEPRQRAGSERVNVDHVLERVLVGLVLVGEALVPAPDAHEPAPQRRNLERGLLRIVRKPVAVV
jgi:hypothetical protein